MELMLKFENLFKKTSGGRQAEPWPLMMTSELARWWLEAAQTYVSTAGTAKIW